VSEPDPEASGSIKQAGQHNARDYKAV